RGRNQDDWLALPKAGERPQLVSRREVGAQDRIGGFRALGDRAAVPDHGIRGIEEVEGVARSDGTTERRNDRIAGPTDGWEGSPEAGDRVDAYVGRGGRRPVRRTIVVCADNERSRDGASPGALLRGQRDRQDLPQVLRSAHRRGSYQHHRSAARERGSRLCYR